MLLNRASDPVWFTRNVLGHDPWEIPEAVMRGIANPRARVAVKACHSVGKTHTAAEIVLWWVCTGGIAITTAPSWTQVKRVLWGEIHKAHAGARYPLGGTLNLTEYRLAADRYAMGISTDEGVRFQGFHGRVLIVLDEAPGIRPDIYEAIEGVRAGGDVRILALGNPTVASGPFYDAFATNRVGWQTFTVDAFDTPNLRGWTFADCQNMEADDPALDYCPRPYLTTRRWVWEKLREWGERSPMWQSRVRGAFPDQAEDALIALAWLERARVPGEGGGEWFAGLDVAGPGEDETALVIRGQSPIRAAMCSPRLPPTVTVKLR